MKLLFILLLTAATCLGQEPGLLVPGFEGPGVLGLRTATILNLQVRQTLKQSDARRSLGRDTVYLDAQRRPPRTHAEAEQMVRNQAQLVLWGKTWEYGSGVVVQARLSIPRSAQLDFSMWRVAVPRGKVSVLVPEWRYEFAPIVLKPELARELSAPDGLKLYRGPRSSELAVYAGESFTALEQGPDFVKVRAQDGTLGYMRLTGLSKNRSEVVDFTGGLLRILRRDWAGAMELLKRVVDASDAPAAIKIDALLFMGAAAENLGKSGVDYVMRAYQLNPYLQATVKYKCMAHLAEYRRAADQRQARTAMTALRDTITRHQSLFAKDDKWLATVKAVLE